MSLAHPSENVPTLAGSCSQNGGEGLDPLRIPNSLQQQLWAYRRRVRVTKMAEATAIAAAAWLIGFLVVYAFDRLFDTPGALRGGVLLATLAVTAIVPLFLYRWVWNQSDLEQLARLLRRKLPGVGDQLLGIIELTHNAAEQRRSLALCQAAMHQVAKDAKGRDFLEAVPESRHRSWSGLVLLTGLIVVLTGILYPAAAANAWVRFAAPWSETPRYTFTRIDPLPERWVVAHGEPTPIQISLQASSQWQPEQGELAIGTQPPLFATHASGQYLFTVPPQIDPQWMRVRVGDVSQRLRLEPMLRPSLKAIVADVTLPEYLGRPGKLRQDVRGGAIRLVKGSRAAFTATANRELASGSVQLLEGHSDRDGSSGPNPLHSVPIHNGTSFGSNATRFDISQTLRFDWQDRLGLTGSEPFTVSVTATDDEPPTLICEGLPRQAVVLESELLKFKVVANDDFGIRRVGLMWRGLSDPQSPEGSGSESAEGERLLAAGDSEREVLEAVGTFSANALEIEPQPIELFVWAEDYLPERPRVFSPPHVLYVLTPDQHAIWITEQLSKWHRQALEVRDRELQLYETNKELRGLSPAELDRPETRQRIERQSSAERSNGRRLASLSEMGDELIRTAARNPEIGVGHLDRWAEMLQILKDVSANRMPSVADLLKEAAESPKLASQAVEPSAPVAGQNRAAARPAAGGKEEAPLDPATPKATATLPQIVDVESSQNSPHEADGSHKPGPPKKPSTSPLRLPVTTVMGKGKPAEDAPPPEETIAEAVREQEDLLAEFERIADELNTILANLEGSTLVKRLKAASRAQDRIAGRISDRIDSTFGQPAHRIDDPVKDELAELATLEDESSQQISIIMDDMAAYFQRRRFAQFQMVLNDMRETDVIGGLRQLVDEIPKDQGVSLAQCEYWSDTLDRWAEDLVDPACSGTCPGGKSPESLPPSIVLEVMQILEAEVNLREETRVAEQAKAAQEAEQHAAEATRLSEAQMVLAERIVAVGKRIEALPESDRHFGKELALLAEVDLVMKEAARILSHPETGPRAIAAETEAIELLLQSKRINPKSGGGGGSAPGGGGTGSTVDSALALLGTGVNQKEVRESRKVPQTTGETGSTLPEEFRLGLDEYFNRLDEEPR